MWSKSFLCFACYLCLFVSNVCSIYVPSDVVDKKALNTIGIKTLGWQSPNGQAGKTQLEIHHNYSKVQNVNNPGETKFSQSSFDQESTRSGNQEQDINDHLSDFGDQQEQVEVEDFDEQTESLQQINDQLSGFKDQEVHESHSRTRIQKINSRLSDFEQQIDQQADDLNDQTSSQLGYGENQQNLESTSQNQYFNDHLSDFTNHQATSFDHQPNYKINLSQNQKRRQQTDYNELRHFTNAHGGHDPIKSEKLRRTIQVDRKNIRSPYLEQPVSYKKCPKHATGQFVFESSCNQFLNCWKGRGYVQNCAPGTLFNPESLECDYSEKVTCIAGPRESALQNREPLSAALQATCPREFSGIIPHYTDCSKFINCANGVEVVMDCPPGTLFDIKTNVCDFPHKTECANEVHSYGNENENNGELYGTYGSDYKQDVEVDQVKQGARIQDSRFHFGFADKFVTLQPYRGSSGHTQDFNRQESMNINDNLGSFGNRQNNTQSQASSYAKTGVNINNHLPGFSVIDDSLGTFSNQKPNDELEGFSDTRTQSNFQGQTQVINDHLGDFTNSNSAHGHSTTIQNINNYLRGLSNASGDSYNTGTQGQFSNTTSQNFSQTLNRQHPQYAQNSQFAQGIHGYGVQYSQDQYGKTGSHGYRHDTQDSYGQNSSTLEDNTRQHHNFQSSLEDDILSLGLHPNFCQLLQQGFTEHPENCAKFLFCENGRPLIGTCQPGTFYDPIRKLCHSNYHCNKAGNFEYGTKSSQLPECPPNEDGSFPHPTNCSKFLYCVKGKLSIGLCQFGTIYNPTTKLCDYGPSCNETSGNLLPQERPVNEYSSPEVSQKINCPPDEIGLIPHPTNCSKFLNCANGQTFIQECGAGTVFNPIFKVCDWPYNVKCKNQELSGENRQNYQLQVNTQRPKCPPDETGLLPHPTVCSKFLNCYNGQTFIQDCGPGTVFNREIKACDYPYRVKCEEVVNIEHNSERTGQEIGDIRPNENQQGQWQQRPNANNEDRWTQNQNIGWQEQNRGQNQSQKQNSHLAGQNRQWQNPNGQFENQSQNNQRQRPANARQNVNQQNKNREQTSDGNSKQGSYYFRPEDDKNWDHVRNRSQNYGQTQNYGQNQSYGWNLNKPTSSSTERNQNYDWNSNRSSSSNLNSNFDQQNQNYGQNQNYEWNPNRTRFDQNNFLQQSQRENQTAGASSKQLQNKQVTLGGVTGAYRPSIWSQNADKSSKHSPPPFPSTDTNADYVFEYEDTEEIKIPERKVKNACEVNDFRCSDRVCIPQSMVCDSYKDCPDGKDEFNCEKYVEQFTLIPGTKLAVREEEKLSNATVTLCAKYCMETRIFQCKSFNYRKNDGMCFIFDTNVGLSGSLFLLNNYDYYEYRKFTIDCTNKYKCSNQKCIEHKQLCDGVNDCPDTMDEKGCKAEQLGYEVRFVGSGKPHEGIVQVSAFGKTGYICDDMFGLRDGDVLCRELGFPLGALEVRGNSYFTAKVKQNETFYMMDDVTCLGNETTLRDCDFSGWGVHNCMDQEIVGVVCKTPQEKCPKDYWRCETGYECLPLAFVCDGVNDCDDNSDEGSQYCEAPIELRLVGGKSNQEGRVEIKYHGTWGTICDDDFNDDAAKVICKYLGHKGSAYTKKEGYYGAGEGPIWLDQIYCQGNETAIQDCLHWDWGEHNCEHTEDVGVICSDYSFPETIHIEAQRHARVKADVLPKSLFPERCGYRNDDIFLENDDVHFRVVKGSIAKRGGYPWQASLRVRGKTKPTHWCGAVIISERFVLTAAHCLDGFTKGAYIVSAGDYNIDVDEGTEQEAYIEDFYAHEHFRNGTRMNNDIALIKLKGEGFNLTKDVQPICLPDSSFDGEEGLNCTISGFGSIQSGRAVASKELRAGWIPIQSEEVCKMPHIYGEAITDGMICAGSLDEGVDACDGDSGGPLACLHYGFFTLMGLTSWGQHCGYANKPGVYVKISHYRNWIDETMKKHS